MQATAISTKVRLVYRGGNVRESNAYDDVDTAKAAARKCWRAQRRILDAIALVDDDGNETLLWRRPVMVHEVPAGYYAANGRRYNVGRPDEGKWCGWTFLRTGSDYYDRKTIAVYRPSGEPTARTSEHGQRVMETICASPLERMQEYGRLTGSCGRCGRKLEDPESVQFGIGPVCRKKAFG